MGVYDKLLKKHYTPPQRQTPASPQVQRPLVSPISKLSDPTKHTVPKVDIQKPTASPLQSERPNGSTGQEVNARSDERPNATTNERLNVRRMIKRASYELFTDQIEAIRQLALEDRILGGKGNQSEMVRNALDNYLKQKGKKS